MVFVPRLNETPQFKWIQHRKVVYIPKKPGPTSPSNYRPLSMLEVLYKIPSGILAKRLSKILPTVIGPHQHGFMANRGIEVDEFACVKNKRLLLNKSPQIHLLLNI
jgi:hypothetical protein